ncbi:MAG: hypothetical protein K6F53_07460 [Lachnospiraceae bacterium]|nr:hypothetical protein [Lachnospiraceae bacterium]
MKKRLMILLLALVLLFTSSCGVLQMIGKSGREGSDSASAKEREEEEEEEEEEPTPEPTPLPTEEPTPSPEPTATPFPVIPAYATPMYTDDFSTVSNYDLYNNEGNDPDGNDLSGKLLWITGIVEDYTEDRHALIVNTADGAWAVSCGGGATNWYYDEAKTLIGEWVNVFCGYVGYSDTHELPLVSFVPNAFTATAYRIEKLDGSFRLTYPDTYFQMPEFKEEKTIGNLTYKEPEGWEIKSEDKESGTIYMPDFDAPEILLMNAIELPKGTFDETSEEELLKEIADYYAGEEEAVNKEAFKLKGKNALRFEMTMEEDGIPCPIDLYSYIIIDGDVFYYVGVGEPYLVGEANKAFMEELADTFEFGKTADNADAQTDDKKDADADQTKEGAKDTADKDAASEKKVPTRAELQSKTFSQYIEATMTYQGETFTDSEEIGPASFTADDLKQYNEKTGRLDYVLNENGMVMNFSITFSYDKNGKIVYSGPLTADFNGEGTATGTVSGHEY